MNQIGFSFYLYMHECQTYMHATRFTYSKPHMHMLAVSDLKLLHAFTWPMTVTWFTPSYFKLAIFTFLFIYFFISYWFIYVFIYWRNWPIDCLHVFHFEKDVASLLVALAAELCETREVRGCCNAVSPWLTPSSLHHDTVIVSPRESRSWL